MTKVRCPICEEWMPLASVAIKRGSSQPWPYAPFCSRRCQLIDLGRWLGGAYRLAGEDGIASAASDDPDDQDAADAPKPAVPSADSP